MAYSVVEILITGDTKHATIFQLFGQRENVKIKKSDLPLVPIERWISRRPPNTVRLVAFLEEAFIPLAIHVPLRQYKTWNVRERAENNSNNTVVQRTCCMV